MNGGVCISNENSYRCICSTILESTVKVVHKKHILPILYYIGTVLIFLAVAAQTLLCVKEED